jgi:hypothetical protein
MLIDIFNSTYTHMKTAIRNIFLSRHGRTPTRSAIILATGLLAVLAWSPGYAQDDLPFSGGSDGADGPLTFPVHPTSRELPALGYDEANGKLVLFGGSLFGTGYPQTWTTSDPSMGWELIQTDTVVPNKWGAAMAWDATNSNLLMFGGSGTDDMWTWDGSDWTEVDVTPKPPARSNHSLVADPATGDIYLYGGRLAATNSDSNDLWVWNGTSWSQLNQPGTTTNHVRFYTPAVWDASDSTLYVYNSAYNQTFKFESGDWIQLATGPSIQLGLGCTFVYNPATESSILFGGDRNAGETWELRDGAWIKLAPSNTPPHRYYHASAYHAANIQLVITQGWMDAIYNGTNSPRNYDTWVFENGDWSFASGRYAQFDMSGRANGIWNFTSINIPYGTEVLFDNRNTSNTGVVWLATENVHIGGILRLDGHNAVSNNGTGNNPIGGPGGGAGGLGAIRFNESGNYTGTPGQGYGGGAPGVLSGEQGSDGQFSGAYGNSLLLPLLGGSGGGGGASNDTVNGGHGGGGGGAILIASDKDITVNGTINTDGGFSIQAAGGGTWGGKGSGGGIKLMADRIEGTGSLLARGGRNLTDGSAGRIRLEAYFRPLAAKATPSAVTTAPIGTPQFSDQPRLTLLSVAGENVTQPATGVLQTPDVVFTSEGMVTILVGADNVPVGTPVTLRITSNGNIINLPAPEDPEVTLDSLLFATFSTVVPAGIGTIQAYSEYTP